MYCMTLFSQGGDTLTAHQRCLSHRGVHSNTMLRAVYWSRQLSVCRLSNLTAFQGSRCRGEQSEQLTTVWWNITTSFNLLLMTIWKSSTTFVYHIGFVLWAIVCFWFIFSSFVFLIIIFGDKFVASILVIKKWFNCFLWILCFYALSLLYASFGNIFNILLDCWSIQIFMEC